MGENQTEMGFTVVELLVTLVVMALFLTLFFQIFMTGISQQTAITQRAAADDIAQSNLRKITTRAGIPASTTACGGAANDATIDPNTLGSIIVTNKPSTTPTWSTAGMLDESLTNTNLPTGSTVQELRVIYPRGCTAGLPAKIVSTVTYGSESVSRATYVN